MANLDNVVNEKRNVEDLALFGGPKAFASIKPVGQLAEPPVDAYIEDLAKAFAAHEYSAPSLAVERLESALSTFHGVDHVVTLTNACVGLVMLLRRIGAGRKGNVIIPAFSYSGIPHVVQWAGLTPRFCDVEERRHGLDPEHVTRAIDRDTLAILAVANVHGTCEIDELSRIAQDAGVPLVLDSVSALGATYHGRTLGSFGSAEVFSLHSTKLINGFEGGYVTTTDASLAKELRAYRDLTMNGLNTMSATLALATLDGLDEIIERNRRRHDAYIEVCREIEGIDILRYVDRKTERYSYQMTFCEVRDPWPLTREQTIAVLRAENAFSMSYYSPALHRSSHCPAGMTVPDLPAAERLAKRFMYLPGGEHTSAADVETIGKLLRFIGECGTETAGRIEAAR